MRPLREDFAAREAWLNLGHAIEVHQSSGGSERNGEDRASSQFPRARGQENFMHRWIPSRLELKV